MTAITPADVLDREAYLARRDDWRRELMVEKNRRRVALGAHCTLHFESRETLLYQIHEMLRVEESWTRAGAVEDEIEAYAPLVPGRGALSATVMFEYEDPDERSAALTGLVGVERHLWVEIEGCAPIPATFDPLGLDPHKISSVQYVRFPLPSATQTALARPGTVVRVRFDHPAYAAVAVLGEETRAALARDTV